MKASTRKMTVLVLWAVGWAIAFIASAILFKGNPIKEWIQAALLISGFTALLFKFQRPAGHCSKTSSQIN